MNTTNFGLSAITRRHLLLSLLVCGPAADAGRCAQGTPDRTTAMIRQADFIGLVEGDATMQAQTGEWRQAVYPFSVEALKGALPRTTGENPAYPYMWGGHVSPVKSAASQQLSQNSGWPTWFGEKGVYLVFLHRGRRENRDFWTTLATFPVDYRPDATGRIVGTIGRNPAATNRTPLSEVNEVRTLVKQIVDGGPEAGRAGQKLTALFHPMLTTPNTPPKPVSYEQRLKEVQPVIAAIRPGTTRAAVEQIFRKQDGGLMSMSDIRYYLGSEVMVEVPYDDKGRVKGPIKVERSRMHFN